MVDINHVFDLYSHSHNYWYKDKLTQSCSSSVLSRMLSVLSVKTHVRSDLPKWLEYPADSRGNWLVYCSAYWPENASTPVSLAKHGSTAYRSIKWEAAKDVLAEAKIDVCDSRGR